MIGKNHIIKNQQVHCLPALLPGIKIEGTQEDPCKLFVGGLSSETTQETLVNYFSQFGTVASTEVVHDHNNDVSRGFGFVTFTSPVCVENVFLMGKVHYLNGRFCDIKRAIPREGKLHEAATDSHSVQPMSNPDMTATAYEPQQQPTLLANVPSMSQVQGILKSQDNQSLQQQPEYQKIMRCAKPQVEPVQHQQYQDVALPPLPHDPHGSYLQQPLQQLRQQRQYLGRAPLLEAQPMEQTHQQLISALLPPPLSLPQQSYSYQQEQLGHVPPQEAQSMEQILMYTHHHHLLRASQGSNPFYLEQYQRQLRDYPRHGQTQEGQLVQHACMHTQQHPQQAPRLRAPQGSYPLCPQQYQRYQWEYPAHVQTLEEQLAQHPQIQALASVPPTPPPAPHFPHRTDTDDNYLRDVLQLLLLLQQIEDQVLSRQKRQSPE